MILNCCHTNKEPDCCAGVYLCHINIHVYYILWWKFMLCINLFNSLGINFLLYLKGWARCDDLEQQEIRFKACVCEIQGRFLDIETSQVVLPILLWEQSLFAAGTRIDNSPKERYKDKQPHRQNVLEIIASEMKTLKFNAK